MDNNAQAVLTDLLARAMQVRLTPARFTNSIYQASLTVRGSLGNLFMTDKAPW